MNYRYADRVNKRYVSKIYHKNEYISLDGQLPLCLKSKYTKNISNVLAMIVYDYDYISFREICSLKNANKIPDAFMKTLKHYYYYYAKDISLNILL